MGHDRQEVWFFHNFVDCASPIKNIIKIQLKALLWRGQSLLTEKENGRNSLHGKAPDPCNQSMCIYMLYKGSKKTEKNSCGQLKWPNLCYMPWKFQSTKQYTKSLRTHLPAQVFLSLSLNLWFQDVSHQISSSKCCQSNHQYPLSPTASLITENSFLLLKTRGGQGINNLRCQSAIGRSQVMQQNVSHVASKSASDFYLQLCTW